METTNLQLIKQEKFGEIQTDIYSDGNEMYMTINQLAECLGYSSRDGIEKIIQRNYYLIKEEFSVSYKLSATDGKAYNTRLFNEDGIYEITMLAHTDKAKEFRCWVRQILKGLRKGELQISSANPTNELQSCVRQIIRGEMQQLLDYSEQMKQEMKIEMLELSDQMQSLSNYVTINSHQSQKLLELAKNRVNTLLGGARSEKYKQYSRVYFKNMWLGLGHELKVSTYKDLNPVHMSDAVNYIKTWDYVGV